MNFNEIQELIRMVSKHKLSELVLKDGEFRLEIRNQVAQESTPMVIPVQQPLIAMAPPSAPVPAAPPARTESQAPAQPDSASAADENSSRYIQIKSPMVGTFYRSSTPDKPPFIKVGDVIQAGQPVCIIEAMKLFNEIESDVKGKIVKILAEDASPVEYDQPLFLIDPA